MSDKKAAPEAAAKSVPPEVVTFVRHVVQQALDGYDADGGEVQQWALAAGILHGVTVTEPCGERCNCADYAAEFPVTCYRFTPAFAHAPRRDTAVSDIALEGGRQEAP